MEKAHRAMFASPQKSEGFSWAFDLMSIFMRPDASTR